MIPVYIMIAISAIVLVLLGKALQTDYRRYNQTRSVSIIVGWFLFVMISLFLLAGITLSLMGGRVAEMSI